MCCLTLPPADLTCHNMTPSDPRRDEDPKVLQAPAVQVPSLQWSSVRLTPKMGRRMSPTNSMEMGSCINSWTSSGESVALGICASMLLLQVGAPATYLDSASWCTCCRGMLLI